MDTIKIGEIERPIKFGSWVYKEFARIRDIEMNDVLNNLNKKNEDFMLLVYCGFLYGAKLERLDIDFIEEDVWDWFDSDKTVSEQIVKAFAKTQPQSKNVKAPTKGQA